MGVIILIAVGERKWGDMALNLALSIKANSPDQKIALIYEQSAINGIEPLIEKYFDYKRPQFRHLETPTEFAFWAKTHLYRYATEMCDATEFIFMDADTIIVPGKDVSEWFTKHSGRLFTAYCNDFYSFATKKRSRRDYTFWCDPEEAKEYWDIPNDAVMPQINSSFLYFERDTRVRDLFETAITVYDDTKFEYVKYKKEKPDELCFNIACALHGMLPHKKQYRPIFFQFGSGIQTYPYIFQYYKAFGFAGDFEPSEYVVKLYNEISDYYRWKEGIVAKFIVERNKNVPTVLSRSSWALKSEKVILTRIGGFGAISNGGVINPGAFKTSEGYSMILRSDANLEGYMGNKDKASCVPVLAKYNNSFQFQSANVVKINAPYLMEDFRMLENGVNGCCSAYIDDRWAQVVLELNKSGTRFSWGELKSINKNEKNWGWFSVGDKLFYIHSIEPYVVYGYNGDSVKLIDIQFDSRWDDLGDISCSTMPVRYGDDFLVWVHKKQDDLTYLNSAMIIDGVTLFPKYFYPSHILDLDNIEHPLYISSCIVEEDRILLFAGEGGTDEMSNAATKYSSVRIIDRSKFDSLIKQFPCQPMHS